MAKEHLFDHILVNGASTERLMLMRDEQGHAMCTVNEDVQPHASQLKFIQKDWTGGHGQLEYKDPSMYFEGQSIDTTQPGRVFLGPEIQTTPVYNFLGGAVADDGGVTTTETAESRNNTTDDMTLLPAAPQVDDAYYFLFSVKVDRLLLWISTAAVDPVYTVVWEYYNGSTYVAVSGLTDGTTGFTSNVGMKTVSFTLPADWATQTVGGIANCYPLRARVSAFTSVTTSPKARQAWGGCLTAGSLTDMGAAPVDFAFFSSAVFCATATKIYELDYIPSGSAAITGWTQKMVFTGGIAPSVTQLCIFGLSTGSIMLIPLGISDNYYYTTDGDIFTASTAADPNTRRFLVAPNATGTASIVWKIGVLTEFNKVAYSADPTGAATWTDGGAIGDNTGTLQNLFLHGDNFMGGRSDGLFQLDTDAAIHYLMKELKTSISTKNFKYVASYKGSTIVSLIDGVTEITATNNIAGIGPLQNVDDIAKTGSCVGITSEKEWLYIAMDEGTNTHVYKGKERPDGRWAWCPWVFIGTNACAVIQVLQLSQTDRRLFFGYGNNAGWVILTDNPTDDSAARFAASGFVRMSYTYGANPRADKIWQSVVTERTGVATGKTITFGYYKDTDTSVTNFTAELSSGNGVQRNYATNVISSKRFCSYFQLTSGTSTVTPEVSYFEARGVEKPEVVRTYECVYYVGDTPTQRASTIRTYLRNCRASTALIKLADRRWGESTDDTTYHWVCLQPGYPTEVEILREKGRQPELGLKCKWQEVSFTIS